MASTLRIGKGDAGIACLLGVFLGGKFPSDSSLFFDWDQSAQSSVQGVAEFVQKLTGFFYRLHKPFDRDILISPVLFFWFLVYSTPLVYIVHLGRGEGGKDIYRASQV